MIKKIKKLSHLSFFGILLLGTFLLRAQNNEDVYSLKYKAEQGDVAAMEKLSSFYDDSQLRDSVNCIFWLEKAAEKGSLHAKCKLGKIYKNGFLLVDKGVKDDSVWHLGIRTYPIKKDINKGISYLKEVAISDLYGEIQLLLGDLFYEGGEVEQDYKEAVKYYKRYVNNDRIQNSKKGKTMNRLAVCYRYGRGVEESQEKSEFWRECAVNAGYVPAMEVTGKGVYGTLYRKDGSPFVPSDQYFLLGFVYYSKDKLVELVRFSQSEKGQFVLNDSLQGVPLEMSFANKYKPIEFVGGQDLKLILEEL